jgi:DNA-binding Xre family transcriptional regulator
MAKRVTPRIKQLRLDRAAHLGRTISIREVSRETGIAVSTLRRIEGNEAEGVDFSTLSKLAEFYEVSNIGDLLSIEDVWRTLRLASA